MESIKKLYESLWKSFIKPRRCRYSEEDLGGLFLIFDKCCATRMDFTLSNPLYEQFHLSIYFPSDGKGNLLATTDYVVYAHTHNGSRIEGLSILEKVLERGMGFATFDFRASGLSTGKYVTLGWLEALDLNEVVNFLKNEVKAKHINLWGRSMGGGAITFFLSHKYRNEISEFLETHKVPVKSIKRQSKESNSKQTERIDDSGNEKKDEDHSKVQNQNEPLQHSTHENQNENQIEIKMKECRHFEWADTNLITCVVLDSCFPNLKDSIHSLVCSKVPKVPKFLINAVFGLIGGEIKTKANVDIKRVNPIDYADAVSTPVFMFVGDKDELVSAEMFQNFYSKFESKYRRLKIFPGHHAEERPLTLIEECVDYVVYAKNLHKENAKSMNRTLASLGEGNAKRQSTNQSFKIYDEVHNKTRLSNVKHLNSLSALAHAKHIKPTLSNSNTQGLPRKEDDSKFNNTFNFNAEQESKLYFDSTFVRNVAHANDMTLRNTNGLNDTKLINPHDFSIRVHKPVISSRTIISSSSYSQLQNSKASDSRMIPANPLQHRVQSDLTKQGHKMIFVKKVNHEVHRVESADHSMRHIQHPHLHHSRKSIDSKGGSNAKHVFVPVYESKNVPMAFPTQLSNNYSQSTKTVHENIAPSQNISLSGSESGSQRQKIIRRYSLNDRTGFVLDKVASQNSFGYIPAPHPHLVRQSSAQSISMNTHSQTEIKSNNSPPDSRIRSMNSI